jgi:hypothetical protein
VPRLIRRARLIRSKRRGRMTKAADRARLMLEQNDGAREESFAAQPLAGGLMAGLMITRQDIPHGVRDTLRYTL